MAWLLAFDGVNDRVPLPPYTIQTNDSIKARVLHKTASGDRFIFSGFVSGNAGRWQVETYSNKWFVRLGNISSGTGIAATLTNGQTYDIELKRTGTLWEFIVDGVTIWSITTSFTPLPLDSIGASGSGSFFANIQLEYLTTNTRNYSATDSARGAGATILSGIGDDSLDATGIGFPTDGSQWVNGAENPRTFIHLVTGTNNEFTASNWTPAGGFTIKFKIASALDTGNLFIAHLGEFEIRYVRSQNRLYCYVDDTLASPLQFDLPIANLASNVMHEFIIDGVIGQTTLNVTLDGVNCPVVNTSLSVPNFTGTLNIGTVSAGSTATMNGILADFELITGNTSNVYSWTIGDSTGNLEPSISGNAKDLTYVSVSEGLPTREFFTLGGGGTQWDGNNGTTILIAYPISVPIEVVGSTVNYSYAAVSGLVVLTGSIDITGQTVAYSYSSVAGSVGLTGEILIQGQTPNYTYTALSGDINLTGSISIVGVTASYNYQQIAGVVDLTGEITVSGSTPNYSYLAVNGSIELGELINVIGLTPNYNYQGISGNVSLTGEISITGNTPGYSYSAINGLISIGEGQSIGNVTAGFADDIYSSGFKPSVITVNFKT